MQVIGPDDPANGSQFSESIMTVKTMLWSVRRHAAQGKATAAAARYSGSSGPLNKPESLQWEPVLTFCSGRGCSRSGGHAAARGGGLLDDSPTATVLGAWGAARHLLALVPLDPVGMVCHRAPAPPHSPPSESHREQHSRDDPR